MNYRFGLAKEEFHTLDPFITFKDSEFLDKLYDVFLERNGHRRACQGRLDTRGGLVNTVYNAQQQEDDAYNEYESACKVLHKKWRDAESSFNSSWDKERDAPR
jgi:hypothetical protein